MRKIIIPKHILIKMHLNENLPASEIAKKLGFSENTILRAIRNYDIPFTRYRIHSKYGRPKAKKVLVKCAFCNKVIERKEKDIQIKKHLFCNSECQRKFYKNYPYKYRDCSNKQDIKAISKRSKNLWNNPEFRRKQIKAHKGKKTSKASNEKRSRTISQLFKNPKFKENHLEAVRSLASREKLSKSLKGCIPWNKGMRKPESERKKKEAILRVSRFEWISRAREVRKRDCYICQICGKYGAAQVHHVVPWEISHNDSLENLVTLCRSCHMALEKRLRELKNITYESAYKAINEVHMYKFLGLAKEEVLDGYRETEKVVGERTR